MSDFVKPPDNTEEIEKYRQEMCRILNKKTPVIPSDSTASDVAGIVADFNSLLAALRVAFE
jgi:hypothetical protein